MGRAKSQRSLKLVEAKKRSNSKSESEQENARKMIAYENAEHVTNILESDEDTETSSDEDEVRTSDPEAVDTNSDTPSEEDDEDENISDKSSQKSDNEESKPNEDYNMAPYLWLAVFSVLMFTFPFITFYGVYTWLKESYDLTHFQVNCVSVLASVLVVNMIICLYVLKAFREPTTPQTKSKIN